MHPIDQNRTVRRLLREFRRGAISRRDLLRGVAAVGVSGSAFAALSQATARRAYAQDSTPAPDPSAGETIVIPQGLRTDLSGQSIRAVLADSTSADGPFLEAALAKFGEATGITVEFIRGETSATDRLQAYRQEWAAESSDTDVYQIDVIWPGVVAEHALDLSETLADLAATATRGPGRQQYR